MPRIFEIFGYPLTDTGPDALATRRAARCPFMGCDCDGGGNRYLSQITLTRNHPLKSLFTRRSHVHAGVCSLKPTPDGQPWIVCPRRLLSLARECETGSDPQDTAERALLSHLGYLPGTRLDVWPEVKLKYDESGAGGAKAFDYTFDFLILPLRTITAGEAAGLCGQDWSTLRAVYEKGGYTVSHRRKEYYVKDAPVGPPCIIEIMTCSTSGGNQAKRTTVPLAFTDAMLGRQHAAPGINYRQVWARMASQLIVKSEVALGWGGRAVWVLQDVLVDYISNSTALDVRKFLATHTSEVNILSLSYGKQSVQQQGLIVLSAPQLYAGPIAPAGQRTGGPGAFQDIVRAAVTPSLERLFFMLAKRSPIAYTTAP